MNEPPRVEPPPADPPAAEEPPPLGTWPRMYALVLGNLAFWILVFYLFTRAFG